MKQDTFFKLIVMLFTLLIGMFIINYNYYLKINYLIWLGTIILIFFVGIYFSWKLKFIQINFYQMVKYLFKKSKNNSKISAFESLSMTLAARIGVGSISGVALAIYIGGPGTIFWMWVSGIIISINTFIESYFGVLFQEKDNDVYKGGPSYYIKKGLLSNKLSYFFAFIMIISYVIGFLPIQANTIIASTSTYINKYITLIVICLGSAYIIFKDVKKIASFSSIIVPIMSILYLLLGAYVILNNINNLDNIIKIIFSSIFNLKSGIAGLLTPIVLGIQRGVFASESGLGTSAIAAATVKDSPFKQAIIQVLGVHFTNFIICTITAFIILNSNYNVIDLASLNGIEITSYAFKYNLGNIGNIILILITILFAFSTIISGYYYGESNLKFLFKKLNKKSIIIFKCIVIFFVYIGGIINSSIIWSIVDSFVVILAIINIYSIYNLFNHIILLPKK